MKKLILIVISLSLFSCASVKKNPNELNQEIKLLDPSLISTYRSMRVFENSSFKDRIFPFAQLNLKLSSIETEEQLCEPNFVDTLWQMFRLNETSITAASLLLSCGVADENSRLKLEQTLFNVTQVMASLNTGESIKDAIRVRDGSEIEIFIAALGYNVIDSELVPYGDRFSYRYHLVDEGDGKFRVLYFDNFRFLKTSLSGGSLKLSDAQISKLIFGQLLKLKEPSAVNLVSQILTELPEEDEVEQMFPDYSLLSPITTLNLAKYYWKKGNQEKLDLLLDSLFENQSKGHVPTAIFLTKLLLDFDTENESSEEIQLLIEDIDNRTEFGNAAYTLAQFYYESGNKEAFLNWAGKALDKNKAKYIKKISSFKGIRNNSKVWNSWLELRQQRGDVDANIDLAISIRKNAKTPEDWKKIESLLKPMASMGNAEAMYQLGQTYYRRASQETDYKVAMEWLLNAFHSGEFRAANKIGILYSEGGLGIEENDQKSLEWFKKGSDNGLGVSSNNAAGYFKDGRGTPVNYLEAERYYKLAIEQGYQKSISRLANLYQYQLGEDYFDQAEYWYERGHEQQCEDCAYEVASLNARYLNNTEKAERWYQKVYESDYSDGITWAALSYEEGEKYLPADIAKTIKFYERAVELGNSQAQANLGYLYESGNGVSKDLKKARSLYELSAAQGEEQGINNLATFYKQGIAGLEIDLTKARELYQTAAEKGNKFALNNLGKIYYYGDGVEVDYIKAERYFLKAAEKDFTSAFVFLGDIYFNGLNGSPDYPNAFVSLRKAVRFQRHEDSALKLAAIYQRGLGVEKNIGDAVQWIRKAAILKGNVNLDYYTGGVFNFGESGIEKNYELAMKYYRKAAKKDSIGALNNLGEMYRLGQGVEKDYATAISYYQRVIDLKGGVGMFNMAELYRDGHGVEQNMKLSFEWMLKAAENGFYPAYVEVSKYYKDGKGVAKNTQKAIDWLIKGAEDDYYLAMYHLSLALHKGDGIEKDIDYAYDLMKQVAAKGFKDAQSVLDAKFEGEISGGQ